MSRFYDGTNQQPRFSAVSEELESPERQAFTDLLQRGSEVASRTGLVIAQRPLPRRPEGFLSRLFGGGEIDERPWESPAVLAAREATEVSGSLRRVHDDYMRTREAYAGHVVTIAKVDAQFQQVRERKLNVLSRLKQLERQMESDANTAPIVAESERLDKELERVAAEERLEAALEALEDRCHQREVKRAKRKLELQRYASAGVSASSKKTPEQLRDRARVITEAAKTGNVDPSSPDRYFHPLAGCTFLREFMDTKDSARAEERTFAAVLLHLELEDSGEFRMDAARAKRDYEYYDELLAVGEESGLLGALANFTASTQRSTGGSVHAFDDSAAKKSAA